MSVPCWLVSEVVTLKCDPMFGGVSLQARRERGGSSGRLLGAGLADARAMAQARVLIGWLLACLSRRCQQSTATNTAR